MDDWPPRNTKPRRKLPPWWRRRDVRRVAGAVTVVLLAAGLIWAVPQLFGIANGDVDVVVEQPSDPNDGVAGTEPVDGSGPLNSTQIELAAHRAVNQEREERGLAKLQHDAELVEIARYHSSDMIQREYFAHVGPDGESMGDRYDMHSYNCRVPISDNRYATGAENIAYTYPDRDISTEYGTVDYDGNETKIGQGLVRQWMRSPGHRENILRQYWQQEGIGIVIGEVDGERRIYATQNFC